MSQVKSYVKGNLYLITIFRILSLFLLYTICRLLFLIFNYGYFSRLDFSELMTVFSGGLIFDASAIVYSNVSYLFLILIPFKFRFNKVYLAVLMILFFIINGIALASNIADTVYYEFVLRRTGMDVFDQFRNEVNFRHLFAEIIKEYWYMSLIWLFLMAIMVFLYLKFRISGPLIKSNIVYYLSGIIIFIISGIMILGGARGGFKKYLQPVRMNSAWAYVKNPEDAALVLNTPFTLMQSLGKRGYDRSEYFRDEKELEKIYTPFHKGVKSAEKKDNVVILVLESLNKELVGSLNKDLDNSTYRGYTPFLDSIIGVSKVYTQSYANGRKSIDMLPSIFCSIPHVKMPFVLMTPYYSNNLSSLPEMVKEMGYKTALFHGAPNGSFGLESFCNIIGIDEYYGMDEYNNNKDYDGSWGIWDEEFIQYFAQTVNKFSSPFMATFFSLSSHHPFKLPEKYKNKFPECDHPLQQCILYTDYSLRRFFKTASAMPWFNNTLFIITADHVSKNQRPEYQNETGYFSIPVIFYHPGKKMSGIDSVTIAQQIDIMPTVLNYLGYDKDYIAFGKDLFNVPRENFAVNYLNDTYRLFLDNYLLVYNGQETLSMYRLRNGRQSPVNLMNSLPGRKDSMELFMKAFIQQYTNRMIDNRLSLEKN